MNPPIISVIVAAYNAEVYLERCLNSIAAQTLKDFEVIVVDDGSTDKTGIIADSIASSDKRFLVIHKENGGVASARQVGIDLASGVYSIHVDSDDWVEPGMLEAMLTCAEKEKADLVICDFWEEYSDHTFYNKQEPNPIDRNSVFGQTFNTLSGSLWNKLIRHQLYSRFHISFDKHINFEEDRLVCLKLLSNPIRVHYLNNCFYHYDHRLNTASASAIGFSPKARLTILERISDYCDITSVQSYYDQAVFYIAYHALFVPRKLCPDYVGLFKSHLQSIRRASGFPRRSKILVYLRMHHVPIPLHFVKKTINRLSL